MEPVPQEVTSTEYSTRTRAVLAACALALAPGCVTTGKFAALEAPPKGKVCQVAATWQHEIVYAADPTKAGQPNPGLAGRVYLFGTKIDFPLEGDGCVVVDLLDMTPETTGGNPVHLEQWRFDKQTLKQLQRRDPIGWGYSMFLPWPAYRPTINTVHLKVRYEPDGGGTPIYAESSPMTLACGPVPAAAPLVQRPGHAGGAAVHQVSHTVSTFSPRPGAVRGESGFAADRGR